MTAKRVRPTIISMPIVSREQLEASLAALCKEVPDPRAGILGPRSLAWRIGGDLGVFIGGGRAALLQLAHPFVAHAIEHNSRTRTDVVGRFQRTFRNVFAMVFGELDDALAAARRVHTIHSRVHGELAAPVAGYPMGTPYHANDVDALCWVHATLVDTTLVVRERLDGRLPTYVKDRYIVELHRFAQLFGIPRTHLPASWDEHARYMEHMLASDRLGVTPSAREMGQFLFGRQPDAPQPPLGRLAELVSATLLPPHIARAFELRSAPLFANASLRMFASLYGQVPRRATKIPALSEATRRLQGRQPSPVAAWTERQLFGLATRVAG
ncbi:MAG: oxygenase MpaB family protein [Kofleriaceae bacterium]|nr:oxygenase MpaB family protein [Kofleriaceae bacterium]